MFGFLRDKLKKAINKFSKEVESSSEKKESYNLSDDTSKKDSDKSFLNKIFGKKQPQDNNSSTELKIKEKNNTENILNKIPKNMDLKYEKNKTNRVLSEKTNVEKDLEKINKEYIKKYKKNDIKKQDTKDLIKEEIEITKEISEKDTLENLNKREDESNLENKKIDIKSLKKELPKDSDQKGFFSKLTETFTKIQLSEEKFDELFWELELVLLENNVAVEVIEKIKNDIKKDLLSEKISRKSVNDIILTSLKNSIIDLFDIETVDLIKSIKEKKEKPYVILVVGVNGSGKTTSIAKLANLFQKNNLNVVIAASDTFRAAAIQQLEEHAKRLNVKLIKHDYNSDPTAVAFDAIKYAEAKNADVVIIDTAGRLHNNTNLMRELEKIARVCKPDIKIFVGESITGNDCVEQAKEFDKIVGIDAIILAKADVDEKGGAAISVSYVTKKPIIYLGTGQTYNDLKEFDPRIIIESLEL